MTTHIRAPDDTRPGTEVLAASSTCSSRDEPLPLPEPAPGPGQGIASSAAWCSPLPGRRALALRRSRRIRIGPRISPALATVHSTSGRSRAASCTAAGGKYGSIDARRDHRLRVPVHQPVARSSVAQVCATIFLADATGAAASLPPAQGLPRPRDEDKTRPTLLVTWSRTIRLRRGSGKHVVQEKYSHSGLLTLVAIPSCKVPYFRVGTRQWEVLIAPEELAQVTRFSRRGPGMSSRDHRGHGPPRPPRRREPAPAGPSPPEDITAAGQDTTKDQGPGRTRRSGPRHRLRRYGDPRRVAHRLPPRCLRQSSAGATGQRSRPHFDAIDAARLRRSRPACLHAACARMACHPAHWPRSIRPPRRR